MNLGDTVNYRRLMSSLVSDLRRLELTTIMTLESPSLERIDLKFTPEFFIFDGIISMYEQGTEDRRQPTIEVIKMRGTNHSWALAPFEITQKGFRVFTIET
jgi:KaiC/GvpD/RAD55 family RecA-like ATPase